MKNFASAISALLVVASATPAFALFPKKNFLQIDWEIPSGAFAPEKAETVKGITSFTSHLQPSQLVVVTESVASEEGRMLLPPDAQLYRMVGANLLACSQDVFPQGFVGASRRVCLQDDDGDGRFDIYFVRHRGRSVWNTDGMWFAMNDIIPPPEGRLRPFGYMLANPASAKLKPKIKLNLGAARGGGVFSSISVELLNIFNAECGKGKANSPKPDEFLGYCGTSVFLIEATNLNKPESEHAFRVIVPNGPLKVRFNAEARLLGNRLITGMTIE